MTLSLHVPTPPVNFEMRCPSKPTCAIRLPSRSCSVSKAKGSGSKSIIIMCANGTVEYINARASTPIIPYLMTQSFLYFASMRINAVKMKIITSSNATHRICVDPVSPKACRPPMSYQGRMKSARTMVKMNIPIMPSIDVICSLIMVQRLSSWRSSASMASNSFEA